MTVTTKLNEHRLGWEFGCQWR